jgi:iron complex transport system permease protein
MKVVLDIDKLLSERRISADEYAKLKKFSAEDTGSLVFNVMVGFGAVATAGGALALLPSPMTARLFGLIMSAAGVYLRAMHTGAWGPLGWILLLVGSLGTSGGIVVLTKGGTQGFLLVTLLCLLGGVFARSGLLVALSVLALSETVGAATAYGHASYFLIVHQPMVTVVLFAIFAWGAYILSLRMPSQYQPVTLVFARTSLFIVNFGFWVGSLWGRSALASRGGVERPRRRGDPGLGLRSRLGHWTASDRGMGCTTKQALGG